VLKEEGYSVTTAVNGVEAVAELERDPPMTVDELLATIRRLRAARPSNDVSEWRPSKPIAGPCTSKPTRPNRQDSALRPTRG
jgi:hypothetical protein